MCWGEIMECYTSGYFRLFRGITDALATLEEHNYGIAKDLLITAQQEAEEIFLDAEEYCERRTAP